MLERARLRTAEEGLHNVTFEHGDAQVHPFPPARFDVVISRFGTMFFADPIAAFTNIARAARTGARLVMMVWQSEERNEWATAVRHRLHRSRPLTGAEAARWRGFAVTERAAPEDLKCVSSSRFAIGAMRTKGDRSPSRSLRRSGACGQQHAEDSPAPELALDLNATAIRLDRGARDGEP